MRARTPAVSCTKKPRQQVRKSRNAELEIRFCRVTMNPPSHLQNEKDAVTMNVVLVSERTPPQGEQPIEWVLLTTLPISTLAEVIEYDATRWMIEVFFKTLKSGCCATSAINKVEALPFEEVSRFLSCLAVDLIVSWRVLMICRLGRSIPETIGIGLQRVHDFAAAWKMFGPDAEKYKKNV